MSRNSINKSFKGYGRADEAADLEFRRRTRKRLTLIVVSTVVLLVVVAVVVSVTVSHKRNSGSANDGGNSGLPTTPAAAIRGVCKVTPDPPSCFSSIASSLNATTASLDPETIFKLSLQVAASAAAKVSSLPDRLSQTTNDPRLKAALAVCKEVLSSAADLLGDTVASAAGSKEKLLSSSRINSIRTWLSAALTDHEACADSLREANATAAAAQVGAASRNATGFTSNSLAIAAKVFGLLSDLGIHRRLLWEPPEWVGEAERRVLAAAERPRPDMTVALDGTGTHRKIKEAVEAVAAKSEKRTVIYVKAGTYKENVNIEKSKWNIMMYGDGVGKTIVSGSRNFIDGTPTFHTATFAVAGRGFMARDMSFENTAGPSKHQAVAFRSGSDMSVYHRCSFDGYQDTLYAHSNRQFYRDCAVAGTVDFIFGNAAAVFQNCTILPRQPLPNQFNTITAQGKKDPNMNSAISIDSCTFAPLPGDNLTADTYLGRPWKDYSTTVIMRSHIGGFLNQRGWMEWVRGVDPPPTIFYGEYRNVGPGSDVSNRVNWAGYKPSMGRDEAAKYTVDSLIQAKDWMTAIDVPYDTSL